MSATGVDCDTDVTGVDVLTGGCDSAKAGSGIGADCVADPGLVAGDVITSPDPSPNPIGIGMCGIPAAG